MIIQEALETDAQINTFDQMLISAALTMNFCHTLPMFLKGYSRSIIRALRLLDCSLNAAIATATILPKLFLYLPNDRHLSRRGVGG
jgi:hypothetical protein